jgi:hypothetical protein
MECHFYPPSRFYRNEHQIEDITHWMPMPAPPAAVAAGQGERSGNKP